MTAPDEQTLARIHLTDAEKFAHHYVWKLLLRRGHDMHLAGATVYRAAAGFGKSKILHSEMTLEGSAERLPLILELVDEDGKIESYFDACSDVLESRRLFATKVKVVVHSRSVEMTHSLAGETCFCEFLFANPICWRTFRSTRRSSNGPRRWGLPAAPRFAEWPDSVPITSFIGPLCAFPPMRRL